MIINPMGIFTVSLFLKRNKEKDRKPTKNPKEMLKITKRGTDNYRI